MKHGYLSTRLHGVITQKAQYKWIASGSWRLLLYVIKMFTSARHLMLSWTLRILTGFLPFFFSIHFTIIVSFRFVSVCKVVVQFEFFPENVCTHFTFFPRVIHMRPISRLFSVQNIIKWGAEITIHVLFPLVSSGLWSRSSFSLYLYHLSPHSTHSSSMTMEAKSSSETLVMM
jgi:hypothetical protein